MLTYLSKELYVSEKEKIKGHFFFIPLFIILVEKTSLRKTRTLKQVLKVSI